METVLRWRQRQVTKSEIIAKVFPVNHATFRTLQSKYMGASMSARSKSMNARLAIRMFGKVRNFLNRAIIPRTSTFPATAKTASNGRSTSTDIVVEE